jgi:hypothetical protein
LAMENPPSFSVELSLGCGAEVQAEPLSTGWQGTEGVTRFRTGCTAQKIIYLAAARDHEKNRPPRLDSP